MRVSNGTTHSLWGNTSSFPELTRPLTSWCCAGAVGSFPMHAWAVTQRNNFFPHISRSFARLSQYFPKLFSQGAFTDFYLFQSTETNLRVISLATRQLRQLEGNFIGDIHPGRFPFVSKIAFRSDLEWSPIGHSVLYVCMQIEPATYQPNNIQTYGTSLLATYAPRSPALINPVSYIYVNTANPVSRSAIPYRYMPPGFTFRMHGKFLPLNIPVMIGK